MRNPWWNSPESASSEGHVAARRQAFGVRLSVLVCAALCLALPAHAQQPSGDFNRFEITPFVGFVAGGEFEDPLDGADRNVNDDLGWGLIFDIAADRDRHYEFIYIRQGTEVSGEIPLDMDIQYLHLGGTVALPEARHVVPYIGLTVGATRFSPDIGGLSDETKLSFSVGGGMKVPITRHFGLRFDARALITVLDSDSDIFCVSDPPEGACRIRARSDTFLQYMANLGFIAAF